MPRGHSSNTRVLLLSGSHGMEDGRDGLCDLEALQSVVYEDGQMIPRQTRSFYEKWCKFFKVDVEGEDPRVYDDNDQVLGVKNEEPPKWEARVPKLPGLWNQKMGDEEKEKMTLKIVDCAWYYAKVDDLLKPIKDFNPTTLIIDWCFTHKGFTLEKITTSGIASRIRMETEMFLISKNKQIQLSNEQKVVLEDVENMELRPDEGSVVFLQPNGP